MTEVVGYVPLIFIVPPETLQVTLLPVSPDSAHPTLFNAYPEAAVTTRCCCVKDAPGIPTKDILAELFKLAVEPVLSTNAIVNVVSLT